MQLPAAPSLPDASARRIRQLIDRYKELKEKNRRLKEVCREQQSAIEVYQKQSDDFARDCGSMKAARDDARARLAQVVEDMERVQTARDVAVQRLEALTELVEARKQRLSSTPLKYRLLSSSPARERNGTGSESGYGGGGGGLFGTNVADSSDMRSGGALVLHHRRAAGSSAADGADTGRGVVLGLSSSPRTEEKKNGSVMGRGASMIGSLLSSVSGDSGERKKLQHDLEVVLDELGRKIQENETLHMHIFELKAREEQEQRHNHDARISGDKARQALADELDEQRRICAESVAAADQLQREVGMLTACLERQRQEHEQDLKRVMNTAAQAVNTTKRLRQQFATLCRAAPGVSIRGGASQPGGDEDPGLMIPAAAGGHAVVRWDLPAYNSARHQHRKESFVAFMQAVSGLFNSCQSAAAAATTWVRTQIAFPKLELDRGVMVDVRAGGAAVDNHGNGNGNSNINGNSSDHLIGLRSLAEHLAPWERSLEDCSSTAAKCCTEESLREPATATATVQAFFESAQRARATWCRLLPDCLSLLELCCAESQPSSRSTHDGAAGHLGRLDAELRACLATLAPSLKQFDNWLSGLASVFATMRQHRAGSEDTATDYVAGFVSLCTAWHVDGSTAPSAKLHREWMVHSIRLQEELAAVLDSAGKAVEVVSNHPAQDVIVQRSGHDLLLALNSASDSLRPWSLGLRRLYEVMDGVVVAAADGAADAATAAAAAAIPAGSPRNDHSSALRQRLDVDSVGAGSPFYSSPMAHQRHHVDADIDALNVESASTDVSRAPATPPPQQRVTAHGVRPNQNLMAVRRSNLGHRVQDSVVDPHVNAQHARSVKFMKRANANLASVSARSAALGSEGTAAASNDNTGQLDLQRARTTPVDDDGDAAAAGEALERRQADATEELADYGGKSTAVTTAQNAAVRPTMTSVGINTCEDSEAVQLKTRVREQQRQLVRCV